VKKKVLVTRAKEQAREFADLLEGFGFQPLIFPLIEFRSPKDKNKLEEGLGHISDCDWLLLTSANAVRFFIEGLKALGLSLSVIKGLSVCAVGPRTAEAAKKAGITIDLLPEKFQAEGVIRSFKKIGIQGQKIFFPRAEEGREVLLYGLANLGADVILVPIYRTVKPEGKEGDLKDLLHKGVDIITFTSGSTVRNFIEMLGNENLPLSQSVKIACISDVTAAVTREYGLKTDIIASKNTIQSLAESISNYFT